MRIFLYILIIGCLYSCKSKVIENTDGKHIKNKYATGFEIYKINEGYILKVANRFDKSETKTYEYLLSSNSENESNNNVIIHIPVSRVVCLSTTHCAFINLLGKSSSIKGMSGIDYVYNDDIRYLIQKEEIIEIGSENQIDYERIIALNPDVVFAYGIDNSSIASYQKLSEIGIPVVFVGDFLESHPLGRTEWLKFFSCFYNQLDFANEYFDSVSTNYENISKEIKSMNLEKPNVLVSLPWKGTWWIPGGKSFFAQLINDAGGSYILKNDTSSESVPMTIEEIFNLSKGIKIWLNPNSYNQKRQILEADSRLKDFSPYLNARIFNNNKRTSNYGGNDFWESGIIHPDIILQDLRKIFNPEQTPEYNLFYYKELQ